MRVIILVLMLSAAVNSLADYDRSNWRHWADYDRDCLNTRHEVLVRDSLIDVVYTPDGCRVLLGVWIDPYTGGIYTDPRELDIDHIVPLKWAYLHGASDWPNWVKSVFANDPENLLVVHKSVNRWIKRDKGPSEYLPEIAADNYLNRFWSVARRYNLK